MQNAGKNLSKYKKAERLIRNNLTVGKQIVEKVATVFYVNMYTLTNKMNIKVIS